MTEWIVTSSALIAVVVLSRFFFKGKISRRLQYALWGIVLVRLLLPFSLLGSPISIMNAVYLQGATYYHSPATPVTLPSQVIVGITGDLPTVPVSNTGSSDVILSTAQNITRPMLAWIIGSMIVGLYFAGTNVTFYTRLCKTRRKLHDAGYKLPVYVAEHLASPCLYGVTRPSVYITPKAAENSITTSYVLAHELCHFRHGDHVWSILRGLCLAIWWWNPLVWLAAILSRDDSELACDEAVIKLLGVDSRLAYGRTLLEMVAVSKAPSGLMCAATTMNSGKRSLKERLNLIVKIPKTFVSALVSVLLITVISVGCTFTGAKVEPHDLSLLNIKNMASLAYQVDHLRVTQGDKAFNITARPVAEYLSTVNWKEKKLSSPLELTADLQIEWNEDHELRFYASEPRLAMVRLIEQWRYYSIGPDDYEKALKICGLATTPPPVSYTLMQLGRDGKGVRSTSLLSDTEIQLAEKAVMNIMVKSAAWPGVDIKALDECYLLRATYDTGERTDYYAYRVDGYTVMQIGLQGRYSRLDEGLYEKLAKLAQSGVDIGGKAVPGTIATSIDRTDLEACIYDAILANNTGGHHSGDFAAAAYTVYRTVEQGNRTTVYAMAMYMEFGYAGVGFSQIGGSHMPVAISFDKNSVGEYELKEYWVPQNGADYGPSIKAQFPTDIDEDALDTQKYVVAHIQSCYAQAIQYGGVDADAVISTLIESITSSPAHMSNPQAYIAAHQIEFRELLYYGAYTLRYSFTKFEAGGQGGLDGHILAEACRSIMGPAENIEGMHNTGQDWYNAFKANAQSLHLQHDDSFMQRQKPGAWLLLQMLNSNPN